MFLEASLSPLISFVAVVPGFAVDMIGQRENLQPAPSPEPTRSSSRCQPDTWSYPWKSVLPGGIFASLDFKAILSRWPIMKT